jgi:Leucine-rich repeat (LRR) protein
MNGKEVNAMKLSDIEFDDEVFKTVVMASGVENAEELTHIRGRKKSIKSAKGIEHFSNLKFLDLTRNMLAELDLTHNPLLEELYVGNNQLEELDLSCNPNLTHLEIFINDIAELDLSASSKLENLYANGNELSELDLSASEYVEELQVSDNNLKQITLAEPARLKICMAQNNFLPEEFKASLRNTLDTHNLKL